MADPSDTPSPPQHFADELIARCRELGHPLCVGIDPHLPLVPALFRSGTMSPRDPETAEVLVRFFCAVIDRLQGRVPVLKPQIAFFEQLGWRGLEALGRIVEHAHSRDLLVLLDAKRGDIDSTAAAYARAYLGADAPLAADALTVNAYLGLDTLEPFVDACRAEGRGIFVLVRTSNPGAGDVQDAQVGGAPLFVRLAEQLAPLAKRLTGPATGWSSLGVVVGATWPDESRRVREQLPSAVFLVPGYGAQGGSASDAVAGFVPGPKGLEGGVVSSSRGILFADAANSDDAKTWESGFEAALGAAIDQLGSAVGRS